MLSATVALRAGARRAGSRLPGAAVATTSPKITTASRSYDLAPARAFSLSSRVLAKPPDRTREIIAETIKSIGSRREGQQYLKLFSSVSSQKFAVVKVGGHCLEITSMSSAELGLYPVIIHGAGPQLNQLLLDAGVEPQFEEGIRVTDAKTLGIARKLFLEENLKLVKRLDELGVATRSLQGVFQADYLDKEKWQYVGNITKVNTDAIQQSIEAGYIPILNSMAESEDGYLLNVNADVAAAELALALAPLKIIFLSEAGGLFNGEGQKISLINLDQEYDDLMKLPWMKYGKRLKVKQAAEILKSLPRTSSVAIIHPSDLQRELFTDSGAGTLIRRGTTIKRVTSLSQIEDLDKLKETLVRHEGLDSETNVDQFLNYLKESPFTAYYDDTMQCLAIVEPAGPHSSVPTLSKLAIAQSGWLTNIPEDIFTAIKKDYPSLTWTIREDDENLTWYFEKADGTFKNGNGSVLFHYGIEDPSSEALVPIYKNFIS
ncbi:Aspartate/glutamate/uridylate kinase [Stachybotrys elegans]|uniref:acetylglutamate kinase n=1 Tax=Stachybotrys elegans TaxID=80388 RepID=A0A8K0WVR2_9HYPO|nr:Aspartate/glutamate/uridylate kinase [Stachybotrys elegans]